MTTKITPAIEEAAGGGFIWRITFIAGLSGVLFGYDASSINDAIQFITKDFGLGSVLKGVVVSCLLAGAAVGALCGGYLADRIGRKVTIMVSGVLFMFGVFLAALAPEVSVLIVGRIIIGLAIGVTSSVTPLFIAEVAPPDKRGGMVTLFQLSITIGILLAFIAGLALTPTQNWRVMILLAVIPALVQLLAMISVPESPRYLITKGDLEGARKTLAQLRESSDVDSELNDIVQTMQVEKSSKWSHLFSKQVRPAFIAGVGIIMLQAFCGINAIMYYSTNIFEIAGFKGGNASAVASLVIGVINVATTVVAIKLVNKYSRKPLLYAGLSVIVFSLVLGGIALQIESTITHIVVLIALITFVIGFAFSLGPIGWLLVSEVFPLSIRGRAAAFATSTNWWANFIVGLSFPILVGSPGIASRVGISFFIFAAISFIGLIFVKTRVPETRNKSLEAIERSLSPGAAPLAPAKG